MPNRIIKESICTSDTIDSLSLFGEVVFYRLIVNCDDFGRFDARPKVLSSRLFPLKDIAVDEMQKAIDELSSVGLITVYVVDGRPYLQVLTWDKHQTTRAKKSKYPSPSESNCAQLQSENICMQMQADENNGSQMSPYSYSLYENRDSRACACAREGNDNDDDDCDDEDNPFGDGGGKRPDVNTLEVYAANNIINMHGRNLEKLVAFREDLSDDLIRYAIDQANKYCKTGMPTYAYVESILRGLVSRKIQTVAQAEAADEAGRSARGARSSPIQEPAVPTGKWY